MSREQKRRAEDVAERISGVRDVTNQLRVTRNGNGHDWAADSSRASGPGITSSQPVNEASGRELQASQPLELPRKTQPTLKPSGEESAPCRVLARTDLN